MEGGEKRREVEWGKMKREGKRGSREAGDREEEGGGRRHREKEWEGEGGRRNRKKANRGEKEEGIMERRIGEGKGKR